MSTIKEVAKAAGLSIATVSRVFSGDGYTSVDAREKVERAALGVGYRPNALARALRNRKSKIIGLVVPDIVNEFYKYTASVLQEEVEREGYGLILGLTNTNPDTERRIFARLGQQQVDGIAFVPTSPSAALELRSAHPALPLIELHRRFDGDPVDSVLCDEFEGSAQLTQHLLDLGHRRLALIVGQKQFSTTENRVSGVESAWSRRPGPRKSDVCRILHGSYTSDWGLAALKEQLGSETRPTAVIAGSSFITLGCLQAIQECGVRCPEDISLVSVGQSEWFRAITPRITAFKLPLNEMGKIAARMLLNQIVSERATEPRIVLVPGRLDIAQSTARPVTPVARGKALQPS